eukprot:2990495-Rhodomonas_salina.2
MLAEATLILGIPPPSPPPGHLSPSLLPSPSSSHTLPSNCSSCVFYFSFTRDTTIPLSDLPFSSRSLPVLATACRAAWLRSCVPSCERGSIH